MQEMKNQGIWTFVIFLFFFSIFVGRLLSEKLTSISSSGPSLFSIQFLCGIVFSLDISLAIATVIAIVGGSRHQNEIITTSPELESTVLIIL
jgi:hypothetical protein